jgi:hypothetical protein
MRSFLVLIFVGALVLAISGCSGDNNTGPDKMDNTISIKLVTPDSGLNADVVTDFVVTVEYELASVDSGELYIGFNSVEVGRYQMINDATALVANGSGEHQFNVTVVTKDWGTDGDFVVYVNLSEHPHESTWTPLATDIRVLTF